MDVLLSIKPKYAEAILKGEKKYEFRKIIFKNKKIRYIYIYSTSPIKKIVGVFTMKNIICDHPENLWLKFKDLSGINYKDFLNYFDRKEIGFAIEIDTIKQFDMPIDPRELMPGFTPPLSFCYLTNNIVRLINTNAVSSKKDYKEQNVSPNVSIKSCRQDLLSKYL